MQSGELIKIVEADGWYQVGIRLVQKAVIISTSILPRKVG